MPLVGVRFSSLLQCFDTVGWVTEDIRPAKKTWVTFLP